LTNFLCLPGAAYNLQALQEKGITHILSLTNSAPCKWPKDLFHCLHIQGIKDNSDPENRISQYFDTTLPFINDALSGGGRILVHCWKGKSRSVSTIAAYLIKHNHISADDALAQIRVTRTRAKPNKGYMEELKDFYQEQVVKPKQP
jgi:protein-tyrosine phosphatase